jgi:hypothetical protein
MADEGENIYTYFAYLEPGKNFQYYFLNDSSLDAFEPVPDQCRTGPEGQRSVFIQEKDTVLSFKWGSCEDGDPDRKVKLTFNVSMKGSGMSLSKGIFLVGEITDWEFVRMTALGDSLYTYTYPEVSPGTSTAYYYLTNNSWENYQQYRETVPEECAYSDEVTGDPGWTTDRALVVPDHDTVTGYVWGTCIELDRAVSLGPEIKSADFVLNLFPVPATEQVYLHHGKNGFHGSLRIYDHSGKNIRQEHISDPGQQIRIDVSGMLGGMYILQLEDHISILTGKLFISN